MRNSTLFTFHWEHLDDSQFALAQKESTSVRKPGGGGNMNIYE